MPIEDSFDSAFTAQLALREKQIQQNYRPIIGVHKWFARRPGTLFRSLLLAEFNGDEPMRDGYFRAHSFRGVIGDPFMGGGTPVYEANRLGFSVVGCDVNAMSFWIVRQSLTPVNLKSFASEAGAVIAHVEAQIGHLYKTRCVTCHKDGDVKYFLWVKNLRCPQCDMHNDLFPGYLVAEATRHPKHVVACRECGALNEYDHQPSRREPAPCAECGGDVFVEGVAARNSVCCRGCGSRYQYPPQDPTHPPIHRLWAIEYHCRACRRQGHSGRFFKRPDDEDLAKYRTAMETLGRTAGLPIPEEEIPQGDETARLHRWGYRKYAEMFNHRQLLGLGVLLQAIQGVDDANLRFSLATVFSDFLRYQNMLCRYDTYALKCQDIFSVHGFPVGLVQCEDSLLGIPGIGSGSFRHFVEKYLRAKQYCETPFETQNLAGGKKLIPIRGESIRAELVDEFPETAYKAAYLMARPASAADLRECSLDGVFTDPPYCANVQYAELMDFCYVWLRQCVNGDLPEFRPLTTRNPAELTVNETEGRGFEEFTAGMSSIFSRWSSALKPGAPFVFTYHHNDPSAYAPLVVAILDAKLTCTATLPAPAEMSASLHIAGTGSSVLDTVFVCRRMPADVHVTSGTGDIIADLRGDLKAMVQAGLTARPGDIRCLLAGRLAGQAVLRLADSWDASKSIAVKVDTARRCLADSLRGINVATIIKEFVTVRS